MESTNANERVEVMELLEVEGVAGENPMPVDAREPEVEEEYLRSIFPEETWMKILSQLAFEDQDNCAFASAYFWELLLNQRTPFLFPKVIEVMALVLEQNYDVSKVSTAEGDEDDGSSEKPVDNNDKRPTGEPGVMDLSTAEWKKIVLNCRLVCSSWNKAIENCYQKPEMTGIPEFKNELDPRSMLNNMRDGIQWTRTNLHDTSEDPELASQFLERFEESHHSPGAPPKNPFLGRYLDISVSALPEQFWNRQPMNSLTRLLHIFGREIWYLELELGGYGNLLPYKKLSTLLRLVPNLKYLHVYCDASISDIPPQSCISFPTLKKLQVLSLQCFGTRIGSELIRRNCHVTHLRIRYMHQLEKDIENSLELPNLQGFSANVSSCGNRMLEKLGPNWTKLKKLYHVPQCHPIRSTAPQEELFGFFRGNQTITLTELHLGHPFGRVGCTTTMLEESKTSRLNLSGVRKLTLCVSSPVFLDFALSLKHSLEHLVIQFENMFNFNNWYREKVEEEQLIQLVGFENRMHESNIWEFFEKLKTVKIWEMGDNFTLFTKEKDTFTYSKKK